MDIASASILGEICDENGTRDRLCEAEEQDRFASRPTIQDHQLSPNSSDPRGIHDQDAEHSTRSHDRSPGPEVRASGPRSKRDSRLGS